jgi:hypothetical protein
VSEAGLTLAQRKLNALWCTDPDGRRIQILESAGDRHVGQHRAAEEQTLWPDEAPWLIAHRGGSMYELRNATDAPMFGVEIAGDGVARKERAHRVEARGGIGFIGLQVWRRRKRRDQLASNGGSFRPDTPLVGE